MPGCKWGPGLTCTYDSVITSLFYAYQQIKQTHRRQQYEGKTIISKIFEQFNTISPTFTNTSQLLTQIRDTTIRTVTQGRPNTMRMDVSNFTNVEDLLLVIFADDINKPELEEIGKKIVIIEICESTSNTPTDMGTIVTLRNSRLPNFMIQDRDTTRQMPEDIQNWINTVNTRETEYGGYLPTPLQTQCICQIHHKKRIIFPRAPPILWIGLPYGEKCDINYLITITEGDINEIGQRKKIEEKTYRLCALIFLSEQNVHYYSILYYDNRKFLHDGRLNNGDLKYTNDAQVDFTSNAIYESKTEDYDTKKAISAIYILTKSDQQNLGTNSD